MASWRKANLSRGLGVCQLAWFGEKFALLSNSPAVGRRQVPLLVIGVLSIVTFSPLR